MTKMEVKIQTAHPNLKATFRTRMILWMWRLRMQMKVNTKARDRARLGERILERSERGWK